MPCLSLNAAEPIILFNGKDLTGCEGDSQYWSVQGDVIVGETKTNTVPKNFLFWRGGEIADGTITFAARLVNSRNNSGVMYRAKLEGDKVKGYQLDINKGAENMAKLYDEGIRGRVCMSGEHVVWEKQTDGKYGKTFIAAIGTLEQRESVDRQGEWNKFRIVAKGNHVEHFINEVKVIDFTDKEEEKASKKGFIALQLHAGVAMRIEFKDIILIPNE
jgi:hypothetical protein